MLYYNYICLYQKLCDQPREAHRYFLEPLGGIHAKSMIYTRFIKFIQNIQNKCKKYSAKYLLELIKNNTNSITGRNLRQISDDTQNYNLLSTDVNKLKKEMQFMNPDETNNWKFDMIRELVEVKQNELTINFNDDKLTHEEIDHLIRIISTD